MLTDVLGYLRCPLCHGPLATGGPDAGHALRCPRGHTFDVARQGYVNLLTGRSPHPGDTTAMVAARAAFLAAGHYDFVRTALIAAADQPPATAQPATAQPATGQRLILDAGAGTGWHLAGLLAALPAAVGLALDVSTAALRRAARAHPRVAAGCADTWTGLPVADASADLVLNVFAPRNGPEFHRVLRPDGALLVVTPDHDHLAELVEPLGLLRVDPAKSERVAGSLTGRFHRVGHSGHRQRLRLSRHEVDTLVGMGPSARHTDPARLATGIAALPEPVTVTASVRVSVYRPRG
ncbi:MAG TPA: methyltransferase domain-containing protein [Catenuloplanes sp.]|jgi:23S rRNA (guanine745-N1)-methyltransferase